MAPVSATTEPVTVRAPARKQLLDTWKGLQLVRVAQGQAAQLAVQNCSGGTIAMARHIMAMPVDGDSGVEPATAFSVRARACFLANGGEVFKQPPAGSAETFDPEDKWKSLRAAVTPTVDHNKHYVGAAYVGYSSLMQGPVFARLFKDAKPPAKPKPPNPSKAKGKRTHDEMENNGETKAKRKTASSKVNRTTFALKGLETYEYPLNQPCGQRVIPHISLTSRCNLLFLKQALSGSPLEDLLPRHPLTDALATATATAGAIARGGALRPIVRRSLGVWAGLDEYMVGELEKPKEQAGPANMLVADVVSDASLLFRGGREPSGFVYAAPLCLLLEYPPELEYLLHEFAEALGTDILPSSHMYLAAHLWVDILNDATHMNEKYTQETAVEEKGSEGSNATKDNVPMVTLAEMLTYFNHWLRWTYWMGLAEFPHPFRFVRAAVDQDDDIMRMKDLPLILEDRVKELIEAVRLRHQLDGVVQGLSHYTRINVFPTDIPGVTKDWDRMHHLVKDECCNQTALALTGLQDISTVGLESYEQPIPSDNKTLASPSCQYRIVKWPTRKNHLLAWPLLRMQKGPTEMKSVDNTWRMNDRSMDPGPAGGVDDMEEEPLSKPRDNRLTPAGQWQPDAVRQYFDETRQHYHQLIPKYIRPVWPYKLFIDEFARLSVKGVDLSAVPEKKGPLPLIWKATGPPGVVAAEEGLTAVEDLRGEVAYDHLMDSWACIPDHCHVAWQDGLERLRRLEHHERTKETLLQLVRDCVMMENADKDYVESIVARAVEEETLEDEVLSSKLPSALGRILGIGPMCDMPAQNDLWGAHFLKQMRPAQKDAADSVNNLFVCINGIEEVDRLQKLIKFEQLKHIMQTTAAFIDELHGNAAWLQDWKALVAPADVSTDVTDTTNQ
ncbi:hypothetical protein V8C44DRAFT_363155 [Trichoderma aethiopicum]